MVLKNCKFGGNTGNTLRKHPKGNQHNKKPTGYISKTTTCQTVGEVVDPSYQYRLKTGAFVPMPLVVPAKYSRKRWTLPDSLKQNIELEKQNEINAKEETARKERGVRKCRKAEKKQPSVTVLERFLNDNDGEHLCLREQKDWKYFNSSADVNSASRRSKGWKPNLGIPKNLEIDICYKIEESISCTVWPTTTKSFGKDIRFKDRSKRRRYLVNKDQIDYTSDNNSDEEEEEVKWEEDEEDLFSKTYSQNTPPKTKLTLDMFIKPSKSV